MTKNALNKGKNYFKIYVPIVPLYHPSEGCAIKLTKFLKYEWVQGFSTFLQTVNQTLPHFMNTTETTLVFFKVISTSSL